MSKLPKLFVPLLDNGAGSVMSAFMLDWFGAFQGRNVLLAKAGDSHANRGMNKIANAFLDTDCDIWINIDADIRFQRKDVDALLNRDLPLVYGIYPKKDDKTEPCLCTFSHGVETDATGLAVLRRCGRGFMLVKREVLEAMKEDNGGPALRYHNHQKLEWDFFPSGVVTGEMSCYGDTIGEDGLPMREWISEDWFFCERARKLGYPTYVDANIALGHIGPKEYYFNQHQVTRLDANITTWQQIHGWFDYIDLYRKLVAVIPQGGRFVEVGSWLGKSIGAFYEIANKMEKPIEVHCVDTFTGSGELGTSHEMDAVLGAHNGNVEAHFRANMEALGLSPVIHAKPSVEAAQEFADGSCDAIFIDGAHDSVNVAQDIEAWRPRVKPGGILCGHDIDEAGVAVAVTQAFGSDFEVQGRCWLIKV